MLRNRFRKFVGILILALFLLAVVQFLRMAGTSAYLGGALGFGLKVLFVLGAFLGIFMLVDRRMNKAGR